MLDRDKSIKPMASKFYCHNSASAPNTCPCRTRPVPALTRGRWRLQLRFQQCVARIILTDKDRIRHAPQLLPATNAMDQLLEPLQSRRLWPRNLQYVLLCQEKWVISERNIEIPEGIGSSTTQSRRVKVVSNVERWVDEALRKYSETEIALVPSLRRDCTEDRIGPS